MDYNHIAKQYNQYGENATTDILIGYRAVISHITEPNKKTVLDYGCGTGKFSRIIRDMGARIIGVDTSEEMIRIATSYKSKPIQYHHIMSGQLPCISDNSIDYVVLNFVLCTINNQIEIQKILQEIQRVLRPNGQCIVLNVNWEICNGKNFLSFRLTKYPSLRSGQQVVTTLKADQPIIVIDYFWSKKDYIMFMNDAGLSIITIDEPTVKKNDTQWIDEVSVPPFFIMVGKKGMSLPPHLR